MVPRKVLSREQIQNIIERYNNKEPLLSIGRVYRVGQGVITRILKENGVTIRKSSELLKAFTEEQEKEVIEKYIKGMTAKEIASQYGLSESPVLKVLKRAGYDPYNDNQERKKKLSAGQKEEIAKAYKKGETAQQLAKKYGVTDPTIKKALLEMAVDVRSYSEAQGGLANTEIEELIDLYKEGWNTVQLAEKYELANGTVGRYLDREGVKKRSANEARGGVSEVDEPKIVERYMNGESSVQIANDYDVYYSTILRVLRRRDCQIRSNNGWGDTVQHALNQSGRFAITQQTIWYIYTLKGCQGYLKPGITNNKEAREQKSSGYYLEQIYSKEYCSREAAFFIEQAILEETMENAYAPDELISIKWNGCSEIRTMKEDQLISIFEFYNQELEEMGVWKFASAYVPMTKAERQECFLRSSAE